MILNKKIPAFTLMEVTIAMLIAAIAIGITFTAYRIVSGSYLDFTKKQTRISTFINADRLLKQDFQRAKRIFRSADGITMEMTTGVIRYEFNNEYVLRDQFSLRTDTFKMKVNKLSFLFENEANEADQLVDQCSFETETDGQRILLYYQKLYSAQDLF